MLPLIILTIIAKYVLVRDAVVRMVHGHCSVRVINTSDVVSIIWHLVFGTHFLEQYWKAPHSFQI